MASKETADAPAISLSDLEEPLMQARNAAKAIEMPLDSILQSMHPLPSQPGIIELILGDDEVDAARSAMADVRCRIQDACKAWEVLFSQDRAAVSPPLAQVSFGRR